MNSTSFSDKQALKNSLRLIVGQQQILFADETEPSLLLPYLEESRGRNVGVAAAVIFPSSTAELAEVVSACRYHKVPMVAQGGNTGRCFGAQTDNPDAVVINLKNMNKIRQLDSKNQTITVEAGCILQDLQAHAAKAGLFFPLSLGAEGSCQIGGNLATNAGGINVLRYGNTRDLTLGIEAVIANGTVLNELSGLRKNNSGYDLKNLLIGSEGTLGIITAATFKLFPPESNSEHGFFAVVNVGDAVQCLQKAQQCFAGKLSSFELIPHVAIQWLEQHSSLRCPISNQYPWYIWYKIADADPKKPLVDDNLAFLQGLMDNGTVIDATVSQNETMKAYFWQIRETLVAVQKHEGVSLKFDVAVPISAIPTLIAKGTAAAKAICPAIRPYIFGHLGDGNLHFNLTRPKGLSDKDYLLQFKTPLCQAIYDIVDGLDGSFSAEHGIGSQKITQMQQYKDPVAIDLMRRIKQAFDPFNLMNPYKVVPPKDKS